MLDVNNRDIDLGTLTIGVPHKFTYTLFNRGLLDIRPSLAFGCDKCTTGSISGGVVKAKNQAILNVTFTPNSKGNNRKRITLSYSDGTGLTQQLIVKFKANVV